MSSRGRGGSTSITPACRQLISMYDVDGWWPARTRFEVMVGAVLVQNTRWANVAAAIGVLRREGCLNPQVISTLKPAQLARLIRSAGCQTIKARRLQAMSRWVERAGGLRRLSALDTDGLRSELLGIHGIGHETADAILCFAFDRPRFVADKYARNWIGRMGLAAPREIRAYETCREFVEEGLRRSAVSLRDLHAAIVLHAQSLCSTRRPSCDECRLRTTCQFALNR